MTWAKFDDHFDEHPKIIGLSDRAFRAFVSGVTYCNRHLLNGKLPKAVGDRLAGDRIEELTGPGLWHPRAGYYDIHDFLDYNPSKEQVIAERHARGKLSAAGGRARAASSERSAGKFRPKSPAGEPADNQPETSRTAGVSPAGNQPRSRSRSRSRSRDPVPSPVPATATREEGGAAENPQPAAGNVEAGEPPDAGPTEPDTEFLEAAAAWPPWVHEILAKQRRGEDLTMPERTWIQLAHGGAEIPDRSPLPAIEESPPEPC